MTKQSSGRVEKSRRPDGDSSPLQIRFCNGALSCAAFHCRVDYAATAARVRRFCTHANTGRASSKTASTIVRRSGLSTPGFTCHQ